MNNGKKATAIIGATLIDGAGDKTMQSRKTPGSMFGLF
jgi:hypothetical protein